MKVLNSFSHFFLRFRYPVSMPEDVAIALGIEISNYLIIEENTGTRKYSVGVVGKVKAFNNENPFNVSTEHRRIFAAYREAMNSSNLFYQLLCFFKVTEGIVSLRRKALKKILKHERN